jgi:hypothetical protein
MTSDSVEILDPTGRAARVDPSKITDIPDHAFGLGPKSTRIPPASMKRITENIRQKLKVDKDEVSILGLFVAKVRVLVVKHKVGKVSSLERLWGLGLVSTQLSKN